MVVSQFLRWVNTARVAERAAAASALARAFIENRFAFEERCAAEAALTFLLDDPSWKVRLALAEALSMSRHAPLQVISALASDQPEVASLIIGRSPLITDADLIDRVATGSVATQELIARRSAVSMSVSAALAEVGEAEACSALLANPGADIASISFRRIAERHGHVGRLREAMVADPRLPSDCRHMLLVKLGDALSRAPLVRALIGHARAEKVARDACVRASLMLIEGTHADEHGALIEHLRLRGDLTAAFLIRVVAHGKMDFFGSALIALSGEAGHRVKSLLAAGGDGAVSALLNRAGLGAVTHAVIVRALKVWREVARGKRVAGPQEVSWLMLRELGPNPAGELASLLKSIHVDVLRENARAHAMAIAAA
jgi:uncharacterized protein (DUF2336 family)